MALLVDNNYHKITEFVIDTYEKRGHVKVYVFENQTARDNGDQPISNYFYSWKGEDFFINANADFETQSPLKLFYAQVKIQLTSEGKTFTDLL